MSDANAKVTDSASGAAGSAPAERMFVLAATYPANTPRAGQPQYFRFWTVIGPAATPDLAEAERFSSAEAAMESPAFTHWASFYEPLELADGAHEASTLQTADDGPGSAP